MTTLVAVLRSRWVRRIGLAVAGLIGAAITVVSLAVTVVPLTGAYSTYVVLSDSMQPTIPAGSVVFVARTDPANLKVGDVISYTSQVPPYPTITHRITAISKDADGRLAFKTRGDGNLVEDPWDLHYASQAGIARLWVPWIGYAVTTATTIVARSVLGILLAGLIGFFWFAAVWLKPRVAAQVAKLAAIETPGLEGARRTLSLVRVAILGWLAYALIAQYRRTLR